MGSQWALQISQVKILDRCTGQRLCIRPFLPTGRRVVCGNTGFAFLLVDATSMMHATGLIAGKVGIFHNYFEKLKVDPRLIAAWANHYTVYSLALFSSTTITSCYQPILHTCKTSASLQKSKVATNCSTSNIAPVSLKSVQDGNNQRPPRYIRRLRTSSDSMHPSSVPHHDR
jgi:hypothetical protein